MGYLAHPLNQSLRERRAKKKKLQIHKSDIKIKSSITININFQKNHRKHILKLK
jgi:hypothetical protein